MQSNLLDKKKEVGGKKLGRERSEKKGGRKAGKSQLHHPEVFLFRKFHLNSGIIATI